MSRSRSDIDKSIWASPATLSLPPVPTRSDTDIAIIGGGFTGLTAALHLAQRGHSVTVLEAGEPGMGASGVNAGFVVPNFAKADPAAVRARLGRQKADRLLRMIGAGAERVFETIRNQGIDCAAEQTGWMHVAHSPDTLPMLAQRVADWNELGRPLKLLSAEEARARTAARHCHGALFDPSGGMLNPLSYARGLSIAAIRAGVTLHGNAPVTARHREGAGWVLSGPGFQVKARLVLLCTNAYRTGVARELGKFTVPLRVYQIATAPLSADEAARLSPARIPFADTRANLFTARLTHDNRLISGGMAVLPFRAQHRLAGRIATRLASEFGLSHTPEIASIWQGTAAITLDFLPHLYNLGPGFWGGIGCNGRGIALTAMLGEVMADLASGVPVDELPVPLAQSKLPLPRLATSLATSATVAQVRWSDWRKGL
ncbi:glycine/D-amino acid oxidase-like deaminating enzyme [Gemmobacter caeni]|uniref:Glycine/D-amino acid oxidase-like deaminating enzyme n=1 Tax=Gemmobacter caeni TaxID=589035 RepID=A0A2T6B3G9_9RHOB|nr:FAD-binding oxidoreductase [Gemmobacter caeni]PTX50575.1 glycine/D-amino acid oxidase-like deaminating enzyme [Gemmobacter caeni]TWI94687.1 glycine/D-amino acid oxidase-like deaminating enzyme [Gemmobacter caeni]